MSDFIAEKSTQGSALIVIHMWRTHKSKIIVILA